ncbi:hypothetical protein [Methanococcoides sp. AM1]|uniref:hypothetical protein n=1 Tax=Methanococcoides sp. AM1 TaxID=1201011 RepID=UPI0010836362|nr:hypothetical protein [Methanococcoides sp. AM1]
MSGYTEKDRNYQFDPETGPAPPLPYLELPDPILESSISIVRILKGRRSVRSYCLSQNTPKYIVFSII